MKIVCGFKSRVYTTSLDQEEAEMKLHVNLDSTDNDILAHFQNEANRIERRQRCTKKSLNLKPLVNSLKKKCLIICFYYLQKINLF